MSDGEKLSGYTIMWVEDDEFLSEMIAKKLREQGAELEFTNKGEGAVEKLRETNPDLLLLDILLPGKDGFEVLEEMKNDEELKDIPVILFSNLGQQEDIDKGYNLGADKFLVKATVDLNNVVDEIADILGSSSEGGSE
jgi:CheY-like chemotaxis protein